MNKVRIGIVGLGNMGADHARKILAGNVPRLELTAVADGFAEKRAQFPQLKAFETPEEMIRSGTIDAILIATPHFAHTTIGIDALENGLHVLVEKPLSVHKADCERLIAAHKNKKQIFAAMFNQRANPNFIKIRQLIQNGELGEVRRINWTMTNWFRPEAYYASSAWRASWKGEGGGVLLNQCPHQLDLFQWMFGMPKSVRGFAQLGRYHDIEVEDDVTAFFQYANGTTALFITSTGEAPGTNRLEVAAERGRLVYENDKFEFIRNETPMSEFNRTTNQAFGMPETWNVSIPTKGFGEQHIGILKNFVAAILDGAPLLSPAEEGIRSVELANATLYSALKNETVELPLDSAAYEKMLQDLIAKSTHKKTVRKVEVDLAASFR
jgi:predicted dehydrogenase